MVNARKSQPCGSFQRQASDPSSYSDLSCSSDSPLSSLRSAQLRGSSFDSKSSFGGTSAYSVVSQPKRTFGTPSGDAGDHRSLQGMGRLRSPSGGLNLDNAVNVDDAKRLPREDTHDNGEERKSGISTVSDNQHRRSDVATVETAAAAAREGGEVANDAEKESSAEYLELISKWRGRARRMR